MNSDDFHQQSCELVSQADAGEPSGQTLLPWQERILKTPKLLQWTYGTSLAVGFSGIALHSWMFNAGAALLAAAAFLDCLQLYWRVMRDPGMELMVKLVPLGALIAVCAVFATTTASGMLATALGADPDVAPLAKNLLTLFFTGLYAGYILGVILLMGFLGLLLASTVHGFFAGLRHILSSPLATPSASGRRVTLDGELRGMRMFLVPTFLVFACASGIAFVSSKPGAARLLAAAMDFRSGRECLDLGDSRIASIPNVDNEVIVVRCPDSGCKLSSVISLSKMVVRLVFERAECRRSVRRFPQSNASEALR